MDQMLGKAPSATSSARRAMVDNQIRTFDVTDQPLLDRFYTVPREFFLPAEFGDLAYSDALLTIAGSGTKRAALVPMVLARLLQGAAILPTDRVLIVGGGGGYAAAIVAGLAKEVVSLESDEAFTARANEGFAALGLLNARAATGKLADGDKTQAPYDVIAVTGAVEDHLDQLLAQLAQRGRLATIQKGSFDGVRRSGRAVVYERFGTDTSIRPLFDASAPVLDEFQNTPAFVF